MKMQHFYTKPPCRRLMLRYIEWGLQNETFKKNGVLPLATLLFFEKLTCTNYPNNHNYTFRKHLSFI